MATVVHILAECLLMNAPDGPRAPQACVDAFLRLLERGRWFYPRCLGWKEFVPHCVGPLRPGKDSCDAENGHSRAKSRPASSGIFGCNHSTDVVKESRVRCETTITPAVLRSEGSRLGVLPVTPRGSQPACPPWLRASHPPGVRQRSFGHHGRALR